MNDFETVDRLPSSVDPLIRKQKEDVAKMRASLLACQYDPSSTATALRNITVLRVFHQVSRIIRYLEMMDKIEEKLYASIEASMDRMDIESPVTWMHLLNIQERLQKNLIESHKLLQPYLNVQEIGILDSTLTASQDELGSGDVLLSKDSRDRLRVSAQQVLAALDASDEETSENE